MRTLSCALTLLCTLAAGTVHAQAQIPYQGRLDKDGVPMNGKFDFRFELYNSRTAGGCAGTPSAECLWMDDYPSVEVKGGRFSVALGSSKAIANTVWLNNEEVYLAIQVAAAGDQYTPLAGRQRILAVPLAARANAAKNYTVTGDLSVGGTTTTGQVFIKPGGTWVDTNSTAKADIGLRSVNGKNVLYVTGEGSHPTRTVVLQDNVTVNGDLSILGSLLGPTGKSLVPNVVRKVEGENPTSGVSITGNLRIRFGRVQVEGNSSLEVTGLGFADHNYVYFAQVHGPGMDCTGNPYNGVSGWSVGGAEKVDHDKLKIWNQADCKLYINWLAIGSNP